MKIEMSIIYDFLLKKYEVETYGDKFIKNSLDGYLFYMDEDMRENYVYIIKSSQLESCSEKKIKNKNFICIGNLNKNLKSNLCNIILLPSETDVFQLLNYLQFTFNKLKSWNETITEIIYSTMYISKIFQVTKEIFPYPLVLFDNDLFVIAGNNDKYDDERYKIIAPLEEMNKMLLEEDFKEAYSKIGVFHYILDDKDNLCFNIYSNGRYVARLVAYSKGMEFTNGDEIIFENLGKRIEELYHKNLQIIKNTANDDELHRLLKSLLKNEVEYNNFHIDFILEKYNWKINDDYQVIKIEKLISNTISISSIYFCTYLETAYKGTCAVEQESSIIWVINYNKLNKNMKENFRQQLSKMLRENLCKASLSNIFNNIIKLNAYFKQAECAFSIGCMVDNDLWCYKFEDYAFRYLMNQCTKELDIEQIVPPQLLKLKKYDEDNNTELCKTLYIFIKHKYNASKTAHNIYIHRTTLLSRLSRIKEITNFDLDDFNTRIHLMISIYLMIDKN